jgi:hypothetical protein
MSQHPFLQKSRFYLISLTARHFGGMPQRKKRPRGTELASNAILKRQENHGALDGAPNEVALDGRGIAPG